MITLPIALEKFMQGQDLTGLKPFALLYRNKWDSVNNTYSLDTANPIDISSMILKPNTLSMTLDVNEVAQYNANNVTLSLSDTENRFVEGTPNSYFPAGYQLYGSKVVLYYGITSPINPYPTQVGYTVVGSPAITTEGVASNFSLTSYCLVNSRFAPSTSSWEIDISFNLAYPGSRKNVALINSTLADFVFPKIAVQTESSTTLGIQACLSSNGSSWNINSGAVIVPYDYSKNSYVNLKYVPTTATTGNYILSFKQEGQEFTTLATYSNKSYIFQNPNDNGFSIGADIGAPANWRSAFIGSININETSLKIDGKYFFNGAHFFYEPQATPLFTGVIKDLPTYKPENYQVDLKLISPLEMLKDIEAKDFSDKVTGEALTFQGTDSDGHRIYWTTGIGVGGFDGVYANGVKLFEGVDYETEQLNELVKPAIVTIINSAHYSATITADYYTWKRDLTVEQIVAGLVGLAGYDSSTEDIRKVVWNTSVRNQPIDTGFFAGIGYYESDEHEYSFNWRPTRNSSWSFTTSGSCKNTLPTNWDYTFVAQVNNEGGYTTTNTGVTIISLGDSYNGNTIPYSEIGIGSASYNLGVVGVTNGISVRIVSAKGETVGNTRYAVRRVLIHKITNGSYTLLTSYDISGSNSTITTGQVKISRRGNTVTVYKDGTQITSTTISTSMNYHFQGEYRVGHTYNVKDFWVYSQSWNIYDNNLRLYAGNITRPCFISDICDKTAVGDAWGEIGATLDGNGSYFLNVYFSTDLITWTGPDSYNLNTVLARSERYLYYVLGVQSNPSAGFKITDPTTYYLATTILLQLVNLSGRTVLEALQDFALISGYEFGVDRQGVFFFRPRISSTTPVYDLDHSQLEKVDTVKKNLSDFFTKLTLTFAQVPLEFYANDGPRPNSIDKYGVINKEIDKPDIVNYDNPELAQAIGPQLLEVYSALPNVIQAVGKINLALELADIVNLKRNYNLVEPESAQEYLKYLTQSTYYRACKITGMNYNFAKRQITYTLRDVSNENNAPVVDAIGFVYELPIELGKIN